MRTHAQNLQPLRTNSDYLTYVKESNKMSAVSRKVNSPQWKPPVAQDPAIVSYQRAPNLISSLMPSSPQSTSNPVIRETGLIEKLLHSYGFVQCLDREARLFFHFSEFNGDVETLQIGDAVEFQMSFDRRSGRPVACDLVKVDPSLVSSEVLSEERYIGSVVQEAKPAKPKNGSTIGSMDGMGRVTYEHNGEWFFLPYGLDDIVDNTGNTQVKPGDQVTFFIATDKRNGNLHARKLELVELKLKKYQGVVCSMKDSFGFIERADAVKEIFFHYSEYMGNINELLLGDDIEFEIQTRNGKEVAVNITPLPVGTVIFEDISVERKRGKILKTVKSNKRASDPLGGRIQFESAKGGNQDLPYGDKDQQGEYTLLPGDIVEFSIATDRRDKLQHATKIVLLKETFDKTTERRETGTVVALKEGFGFIQCAERDARMFFHFSEVLDSKVQLQVQDEVEFTVMQDPTTPSRQVASRIHLIPKGSIGAVVVKPEKYIGTIEKEPANPRSPTKDRKEDSGSIIFDMDGAIHKIIYNIKDVTDNRNIPRFGDKVDFNIGEQRRPGGPVRMAVNVRLVLRNLTGRCQGFIATLKDNYGFIENADHDKELFFHFSSCEGLATDLDLGDEVEYTITRKSAKLSAENIKKLPKGTIPQYEEMSRDTEVLQGKVTRPMRIVNTDQEEYSGLIQVINDDNSEGSAYPYCITSLSDKRDFLQKGDAVKFQVAVNSVTGEKRAMNVAAIRKFIRSKVDSVKDKYGFLAYEVEEGKKLFFHMTEINNGADILAGDEVEFVVIQNQKNGKYSACNLRKITVEKKRPERLLSRLKSMNDEMVGPRVIVIRPPKGPDGTKGFSTPRVPWQPPA